VRAVGVLLMGTIYMVGRPMSRQRKPQQLHAGTAKNGIDCRVLDCC
jgi:hypothetical protein